MKKRDKMLIVAVVCIVTYTAAAIVLQFCTSVEISSTLTLCWYGFWTAEIWALSGITKTKIKNKYYDQAGVPPESEE
jgi:hypothetical protein